jgi:hypothetical protein
MFVRHGSTRVRNQTYLPGFAGLEERTMRKIVAGLAENYRVMLLELADLGVAIFSAGLAVTALRGIVGLLT